MAAPPAPAPLPPPARAVEPPLAPASLLALPWLTRVAQGLVALCGLGFALFTLHLQRQRRRALRTMAKRYRSWQRRLSALEAEHQWFQDHAHHPAKPAADQD